MLADDHAVEHVTLGEGGVVAAAGDLTANNGSCVKLDTTIGRPSLNENYVTHAVTASAMINPLLPVVWFIHPDSGDIQFCDLRHAGLCVKVSLP